MQGYDVSSIEAMQSLFKDLAVRNDNDDGSFVLGKPVSTVKNCPSAVKDNCNEKDIFDLNDDLNDYIGGKLSVFQNIIQTRYLDKRIEPQYDITSRTDYYLQKAFLIVVINLPLVKSSKNLNIDVEKNSLLLSSKQYLLAMYLPNEVVSEKAEFDLAKKQLTLTLESKPLKLI